MSSYLTIPYEDLIEIPSPHVEPRLAFQTIEPRKVDNLTLIDGKTFSATSVSGDIYPPGSPDVGFFHDDTRFLSQLGVADWRAPHCGAFVGDREDVLRANRADYRQHHAARFL